MSDKLAQSQETSIELSEQELDVVAGGNGYGGYGYGGTALAAADANGIAVGSKFAFTDNHASSTAISTDYVQLAAGNASSVSAAAS